MDCEERNGDRGERPEDSLVPNFDAGEKSSTSTRFSLHRWSVAMREKLSGLVGVTESNSSDGSVNSRSVGPGAGAGGSPSASASSSGGGTATSSVLNITSKILGGSVWTSNHHNNHRHNNATSSSSSSSGGPGATATNNCISCSSSSSSSGFGSGGGGSGAGSVCSGSSSAFTGATGAVCGAVNTFLQHLNSKTEDVLNAFPSALTLGQSQGQILPSPFSSPSPSPLAQQRARSQSTNSPQIRKGQTSILKTAVQTSQNAHLPKIQVQPEPNIPPGPITQPCTDPGSEAKGPPPTSAVQSTSSSTPPLTTSPANVSPTPTHVAKKPLKLRNHSVGHTEVYDILHSKVSSTHAAQSSRCTEHVCLGSIVSFPNTRPPPGTCRPAEEVKRLAKDFFDQYFTSIKRFNSTSHQQRWEQVLKEIDDTTGTYNLTETELVYGAKLAWRNSVRCIGRIQWAKLQVFDARSVTTTTGMFEALCKHIKYATNKGNIRSAITIFPQRTDGRHDFRIWNPQLITYAGYRNPDGVITGDPASLEFTEICTKLGWKGPGTKWDILPLVLSADGHDPEYFEIPSDLIVEILIQHPTFDWFPELDLRWYALPAVSGMMFDCGGLEFTACPFNGWYMGTEIGCRDLGDINRYNVLEEVAVRMGLDTKNPTTLWKDRALVELNLAVLYSYQKAGVTVVDHHSASESFMKHYENEMRVRGGCPADWVWIIPPMSGSATPVFHQEMALYHLNPNYEYQEAAWKTHVWKKGASQRDGPGSIALGLTKNRKTTRRKFHFKEIARAVKFTSKLFGKALSKRVKATILYSTETGKSEMYARRLGEIFGHAFNAQVYCMNEYDIINIEHEALILVVTSTFGNGDPPENGESFAHSLYTIKMNQGFSSGDDGLNMATSKSFIKMNSQTDTVQNLERRLNRDDSLRGSQMSDVMSEDTSGPLINIKFAVFALGSSAYPNFCAFGRYVDNLLRELGGEQLLKLTTGDELAGQDQAFRAWAADIFHSACESFCLDSEKNMAEISAALKADTLSPEAVRFLTCQSSDVEVEALSSLHNRKVVMYTLVEKSNLHANSASRVTINATLRKQSGSSGLSYQSGDHVGILAENRSELVDSILNRLTNKPPSSDEPVQLQLLQEKHTPMGIQKQWIPHERLPRCSLRQMLTRYLDITTPPRPNLLQYLVRCTENEEEKERLNTFFKDPDMYEHWKQHHWPNLATVLEQFPHVNPDATVLCTMLPLLQPRFYSVSSSPLAYPDELHLTVAVVSYRTRGGDGPLQFGVCSNYINDIQIDASVPCFVRSAPSFHLPADTSRPIVMVGPGTGIAPFRGFWQERKTVSCQDKSRPYGNMTLFFGCRTKEMILYLTELEKMKEEKVLTNIYLALSREPSFKKTYVQDLLVREGESIAQHILEDGGHVYVCGDCTMAEDVYQTLKGIVQHKGHMNDTEVENFMLSLRDDNRYHEDIFGITHRTAEVHEKVRQTALTRIESNYTISQTLSPL